MKLIWLKSVIALRQNSFELIITGQNIFVSYPTAFPKDLIFQCFPGLMLANLQYFKQIKGNAALAFGCTFIGKNLNQI